MSTFDENGLVIDRFDEVLANIVAELKSKWGENIKVDAQSVTGQLLYIISEAIANQNELIEAVAQSQFVNGATGVFLSEIVKLNGMERKESLYSTTTLRVTANVAGSSIQADSEVSDPLIGDKFKIDSQVVLAPFASANVSATAVEPGPIAAATGTLTKIETPTYGWESVTNISDASEGRDEETDTVLRVRRENKSKVTGIGTLPAIIAAVEQVDGVDMVAAEANTKSYTVGDLPPQALRVVVNGGNDADIAEAIFNNTAGGLVEYFGNTSVTHYHEGDPFVIKFDRPSEIAIFFAINLTVDKDYPATGDDDMEEAIENYLETNLKLGNDVRHSRMYTPVNTIPGHTVNQLFIGLSSPATSTLDIPININQVARTDSTKITITKS